MFDNLAGAGSSVDRPALAAEPASQAVGDDVLKFLRVHELEHSQVFAKNKEQNKNN